MEANPIGLDGVEFVEFAGPDTNYFTTLFSRLGFKNVAKNKGGDAVLFRQGKINFFVTAKAGSFADQFQKSHGPSVCSTGFRVLDANKAFRTAVERGAQAFTTEDKKTFPFPAVYGIGDSLIYFVDEKLSKALYAEHFPVPAGDVAPEGRGLLLVDHFTNNVPKGEMQKWCDFYEKVFNFRETRYFDIRGKQTGLISKVMRSPCNQFAVPINEPSDGKSQIQEYLDEYKGSGIQHIALTTKDIVKTLDLLKGSTVEFLTPPPHSYYGMIHDRLPNVTEEVKKLEDRAILVDGDHDGYLLQIFTKNVIGPVFFEIIQRKNHAGFGEGNFQALFDAIERDQRERGYL